MGIVPNILNHFFRRGLEGSMIEAERGRSPDSLWSLGRRELAAAGCSDPRRPSISAATCRR